MRVYQRKIDVKPTAGDARSRLAAQRTTLAASAILLSCLIVPTTVFAAESRATNGADCTEIDLRYAQLDAPLTDAEIAELRARQHNASLNAFERCITAAVGGGGGNSGGAGSGGVSSVGVATQGIAGSDSPVTEVDPATQALADTPPPTEEVEAVAANGRAPLDIPAADNDSILAAQIRRAAETETDPQRQAKLWNEYRKIRGLPIPQTGT